MPYSENWDEHLRQSALKGVDPISYYDRAKELGAHNLSEGDALLVARYWQAHGGERNEEWIRANAPEFWARQLRDAQNWFGREYETYGKIRADVINKDIQAKMSDLNKWRDQMSAQSGANTQAIMSEYARRSQALQQQQQQQVEALRNQIGQAYNAAGIQDAMRSSNEKLRAQTDWGAFKSQYNLSNIDADRYAGEQSQAANYRQFLESQLGTAGFNAGNLLSGYDPTEAINAARRTTEGFESYKNSLLNTGRTDYDQLRGEALGAQAQFGTQLSTYDQQVRNQLANLGNAYQSYAQLGDIRSAQGNTGAEKVMSLFGFQRPDVAGMQQAFSGIGTEYERIARETEMLYGGDTAKPQGQYQQLMGKWNTLANQFNPAAQGLLSAFGNAQNTLYGMYGNVQDVVSGRIRSEAQRQGGLLSQQQGVVQGLAGQATQEGARVQDLYTQTANRLRASRLAEGAALQQQNQMQDFTERQNRLMSLAATTLQRPVERTMRTLRRPEDEQQVTLDPLGLSRGYSSLLGG